MPARSDSTRTIGLHLDARARRTRIVGCAATLVAALSSSACLRPPTGSAAAAGPAGELGQGQQAQGAVDSVPYTWKSVTILGGGFVTGLIFSPIAKDVLYARTDIGGAYRYDFKDKSWLPLTDFLSKDDAAFMGIESLAADPVKPDRVYMAVGMYTADWAEPGGFMRSDDRGVHWTITRTPNLKMGGNELGRANGERLAVDPNHPQTLYFGSRKNGLWKSEDEAASWAQVDSFPLKSDDKALGIPIILFDAKSGKPGQPTPVIYAGVSKPEASLYRSTDAGKTWQPLPKQPTGFLPSRAALDRDGKLYIAYGVGPGPYAVPDGALYRFDTKSNTFTDISPIKPVDGDRFGYGGVSVDAEHPGTILASTIDRWTKGGEIFRSQDSGKTWKALMAKAELDSGGAPHTYHHRDKLDAPQWVQDVEIDPFNPDRAMLITGGGVWATENLTAADKDQPTRWSFHNNNLEETALRWMVSPPEGPLLLSAMGDLCGFRHDKLDESPKLGNFQTPSCASADTIDYAGKKPNVVVRAGTYPWDGTKPPRGAISLDSGATWKPLATEPAGSDGGGNITVTADGRTVIWAPRAARAAYSRDNGASWTVAAGLPEPKSSPDWAPVPERLAADRVNPKKVYAFSALDGIAYASNDGGAHFEASPSSIPALPEYRLQYASIQTVPGLEGEVWITTNKQLAHSSDSGKTFSLLDNVEESYAIGFGKAAPGKQYPALYFSGKLQGVTAFFRSDDAGEHFVRINDDAHQYGSSNLITGDMRTYGRAYIAPGGRGILYGDPK